ncbi:MAG: hypothetical protein AAFX85_07180 [Pseudomonadota bacterium]
MHTYAARIAALLFAIASTGHALAATDATSEPPEAAAALIQGRLLSFQFVSEESDVVLASGVNVIPGMTVDFTNIVTSPVLISFCAEFVDDGAQGAFLRLQAEVDGLDASPGDFLVVQSENLSGVPQRQLSCFNWAFPGVAPGAHQVTLLGSPNIGEFTVDERTLTVQYFR